MNQLTPMAFGLLRTFRTSGVAKLVAPTHPLGRLGAALALTGALAGAQWGLAATHTSICHIAGTLCGNQAAVGTGSLSQSPNAGAPKATSTTPRITTTAVRRPSTATPSATLRAGTPLAAQTVAVQHQARPQGSHGKASRSAKTNNGAKSAKSAAPVKKVKGNVLTASTMVTSHHGTRAHGSPHQK